MALIDKQSRLRREQDILDRLENVKRLIQMETTLLVSEGARQWCGYCHVDRHGNRIGSTVDDLLHNLRDEIQMQLLSLVALCYGDNPDVGEPAPMLEWKTDNDFVSEDRFREVWDECLIWNA